MKKSKVVSLLFSIALLSSMPALTAKAETIQQDGLAISLTTDKTQYAMNEQIQAKVSVTNNNNQSVYQVQLDSLVPSGYALTSGSNNTKQLNELKAGETIELTAIYAMDTANTGSSSIISTGHISKPETNPFSPTPVNLSNVTTSNNSNPSATTSSNSTGNNNSSTTNSPSTGSAGVIPYVVAALSSAVLVIATKKGKGRQIFSFFLCGSILFASLSISQLQVNAIGTSKADITVNIVVNGVPVKIDASVSYLLKNESDSTSFKTEADEYYEANSDKIIGTTDASISKDVYTEAEAIEELTKRGFGEYPITYDFSTSGEYLGELVASDTSAEKHPMYQTFYVSESGNVWSVFLIGKTIVANPVFYNANSNLEAQLLISETPTLTSYDDAGNKFYVTIPKTTAVILKKINKISSETINILNGEEIEKL